MMKDGIIKGTGNSRNLKAAIPADITHEQLVQMLIAGTLPIDLNGINLEGWQQIGDALCKGNLLDDVACDLLGISRKSVPKDAFIRLGMPTGYHAFGITVTVDGKPLPNVLIQGVKTFAGAPVYADDLGRAIGMSTSDTVTITIDGFLDLQPYTENFTASPETVITPVNIEVAKKDTTRVLIDTSQTLSLSSLVDSYDLFLVGGGASGAINTQWGTHNSATGGGGGYTTTAKDIVNENHKLNIVIGAGGVLDLKRVRIDDNGRAGGDTKVINTVTKDVLVAAGGKIGVAGFWSSGSGGAGGSGGGGTRQTTVGNGGSDGGNGSYQGGTGQGTTTREFGESDGTLYSGGGGAAASSELIGGSGTTGTGGDGGGASGQAGSITDSGYFIRSIATFYGGAGGGIAYITERSNHFRTEGYQGCVVIRWRYNQ